MFSVTSDTKNRETTTVDPEQIQKLSQIYQLKPDDKLYSYHKAINDATIALAMHDPSLLGDNLELQRQARLKQDKEGFNYKKKSSRSKAFGPSRDTPLREHVSQDIRCNIICNIILDVSCN